MRRSERIVLPFLTLMAILASWQLAIIATKTTIFPTPQEVLKAMVELTSRGLLWSYLCDSLRRVSIGYLAAMLTGIPCGMLLGRHPNLGYAFNPLFQMLRPISPLAWIPLAIIWFGVSETAPIFLIFLASFFPIVVAAMNGVRNVPRMYLLASDNFGLSTWAMLYRVTFPAILPRLLTGLRIALGVAWLVLVAAEMVAVDSGLGYLIIDSRNAGKRYDLVVGAMLVIGAIGLLLDLIFRWVERVRWVRWGFSE